MDYRSSQLLAAAGIILLLGIAMGVIVTVVGMGPRDSRLSSFQGCARTATNVDEAATCNRHLSAPPKGVEK